MSASNFIDTNVFIYHLDATDPRKHAVASTDLFHRTLGIRSRWRYGFHDSLVVAAALAAGCTKLLSEDMQHGHRHEPLTIVDPFRA